MPVGLRLKIGTVVFVLARTGRDQRWSPSVSCWRRGYLPYGVGGGEGLALPIVAQTAPKAAATPPNFTKSIGSVGKKKERNTCHRGASSGRKSNNNSY
jgi:hypothetical protein